MSWTLSVSPSVVFVIVSVYTVVWSCTPRRSSASGLGSLFLRSSAIIDVVTFCGPDVEVASCAGTVPTPVEPTNTGRYVASSLRAA